MVILKRHLLEKVPVCGLGDELGLNPTAFYGWQKLPFANGAAAFQKTGRCRRERRDQKIEKLEAKFAQKNEVLAELMEQHVQLRKGLGEH